MDIKSSGIDKTVDIRVTRKSLSCLLAALCLLLMSLPLTVSARKVIPFNDGWIFTKASASGDSLKQLLSNNHWQGETVCLPHTWNAHDMQENYKKFYQGTGVYGRKCFFKNELKGKRVFLKFEGVGSCAEVYLNGKLVGTHRGAYSAFTVELTKDLKLGQANYIAVKADNTARKDVIPVNHVLFGVYGGIYRPVSLIVTDECNIAVDDTASPGVYISQKDVSEQSAAISVKAKLENRTGNPVQVELHNIIYDADGNRVAADKQSISLSSQGMQAFTANFNLEQPHLWQGREDPYLYRVETSLVRDGEEIDRVVQPLGLRKFEIVAGNGFFLNGKKYPMYGVTRHQDRWGKGSALSNADHDEDLAYIMDIGATTIRLAHYQQSEYFYSRCDSLGLVVWAEIPFVNQVTGQEWDNAHQQLRELIRQNYNHPSIYVWGLHNEVYHPHAYTAALTASLHSLAKQEDPSRFTASVNGYGVMMHPVNLNADIQGMNRYFGWYEKKLQDIEPWVKGLERDYPHNILMLTEYGADANLQHQTEYLGNSLNWTKPFYPETFQTKTHEYQWGVIARHPYIVASYLWNMFDFATPMANRGGVPGRNMKGMMTFDRKVKKDSYYWYKANWSKDPVLYITQRRNTDRERKHTSITVYSNIGEPTVRLNGKELSGWHRGETDVHYVLDDVELRKGKNKITAEVRRNGKKYRDAVEWNYEGEKNRAADTYSQSHEHGSF